MSEESNRRAGVLNTAEIVRLREALDRNTEAMQALVTRDEMRAELAKKSDTGTVRAVAKVLAIAMVIAIGVGLWAGLYVRGQADAAREGAAVAEARARYAEESANAAQNAVTAIELARNAARASQCQADNEVYVRINDNSLTLVEISQRGKELTPEDIARAKEYLEKVLIPPRDCSPQGIAEFYHDPSAGSILPPIPELPPELAN